MRSDMDPLSQGALGAIAASATASPEKVRLATLVGWGAGMLADADIFIRSESDPLLNIEYHRHFTHSLIFIPIGAMVAAAFFWLATRWWKRSFCELYRYSLFGYATAGLLDACTSYGTRLLWPFSDTRVALNIISIIDPIFTGTILALIAIGCVRKRLVASRLALGLVLCYLSLGAVQNQRAAAMFRELSRERGHEAATRFTVKPSIGNLLLWRGIYEYEGLFYMDAIRLRILGGKPILYEGETAEKVDVDQLRDRLPHGSVLVHDLERFEHFSDGYLSWHPDHPFVIGDARYALLPQSSEPLWGIRIDLDRSDERAEFLNFRTVDKSDRETLWLMIQGKPLSGP